ncbi:MAG: tRNA-dihydrouridine synthase family protein [Bacteroidota bacterium]|nr:tRNA-dihydrouridine synthase family protein [Bacteroidota bacterium]
MKDTPQIYLAPMQGFTDFVYRNALHRHFNSIDKYFTPYLVLENDGSVRNSKLKEIFPENNDQVVIPQILPANEEELVRLTDLIAGYGYHEININMACPYPMVTRRGRGAGLLPSPEKIEMLLKTAFSKFDLQFSVKLRAGLESFQEIEAIIPILNQYPLTEVILHPRIASQLYKGAADKALFRSLRDKISLPLIYNGDIFTLNDFEICSQELEGQSGWMIGRGILSDPFLPQKIKYGQEYDNATKLKVLKAFHDDLFGNYSLSAANDRQLIIKMTQHWEYLSHSFIDPHKTYKKIKKATRLDRYQNVITEIFNQQE